MGSYTANKCVREHSINTNLKSKLIQKHTKKKKAKNRGLTLTSPGKVKFYGMMTWDCPLYVEDMNLRSFTRLRLFNDFVPQRDYIGLGLSGDEP